MNKRQCRILGFRVGDGGAYVFVHRTRNSTYLHSVCRYLQFFALVVGRGMYQSPDSHSVYNELQFDEMRSEEEFDLMVSVM